MGPEDVSVSASLPEMAVGGLAKTGCSPGVSATWFRIAIDSDSGGAKDCVFRFDCELANWVDASWLKGASPGLPAETECCSGGRWSRSCSEYS